MLIYNLTNKKYKAVLQGDFPLGIIYDNCNYVVARGEIMRYVLQ